MTQTIGRRLKEEREEQRLTLEKVFEATRIRIQYLQALEEDDLSVMPSPVQARGYLRNYAEYLGFDVEQMLQELHRVNALPASVQVIGPADAPAPVAVQEEDRAPEASLLVEPTPEPVEYVESASLPDAPAVRIKPRTTRRKKTDPQLEDAAAETQTKRRGRKKAQPDIAPVVEMQPEWQSQAEASDLPPVPSADVVFIPPPIEDVVIPGEGAMEPSTGVENDVPQEASPAADVRDTLWQSWLNRVGSVLSARGRRRTLTPNETVVAENEPIAPAPVVLDERSEPSVQDATANSMQIFKEIGVELRQRRELLSLHFDEIERNTHVKAHYLEALERGALDELPSTVQTRGMLSNYATFLDLDVDAILLRFADALQARHRERNPHKPARKPGQPIVGNMPPVRSFIAGDMIFGVGMAILLVGFAVWGVSRVMAIQSQQEVNPTAPSISDVLLSSPDPSSFTATATFLPAVDAFPGEATVTVEIPTQNVNAPVQLNLVAVERTYMRVVVDGEVEFDGRVLPGNAYPFDAETQIEVLVGSAAAIRVVYNGRDLGLMGTFGQVVNQIYLGSEIVTPTGLPTMTPSVTPTPTRTAPPTATSPSTATPAPSATAVP